MRAMKYACGQDVSNDECQTFLVEAVKNLKKKDPSLNVRHLDKII